MMRGTRQEFCAAVCILSLPVGAGYLEKATAPHSSTLAWKIPWMEEPGRLRSTGSLRVGHDWATSLSLLTFMHWRRKWQPTPVFLPGESQGRGEPGGLLSMISHRVGHDSSDLAAAAGYPGVFTTASHSSILAWRIPWTVQSMGSQRVRHNWATFTLTSLSHLTSGCFSRGVLYFRQNITYNPLRTHISTFN